MKRTDFEIGVALVTAILLAFAGVALSVVDRLHGQYSGQRLGCSAASGDAEFLARFRSQGGDAGSCWESIEERTGDSL